jgi:hypothetical protein
MASFGDSRLVAYILGRRFRCIWWGTMGPRSARVNARTMFIFIRYLYDFFGLSTLSTLVFGRKIKVKKSHNFNGNSSAKNLILLEKEWVRMDVFQFFVKKSCTKSIK